MAATPTVDIVVSIIRVMRKKTVRKKTCFIHVYMLVYMTL